MLQIKVAQNKISSKELSGRIFLFTPEMELWWWGGGLPQRFAFLKYNIQKWEKNLYINLETTLSNSVG